MWLKEKLGKLHPDTRDTIGGLLVLLFIVALVATLTVLVTLEVNKKGQVKTLCREHGYLTADRRLGEWVCCGFDEDGRVVFVLLSKVVSGIKK